METYHGARPFVIAATAYQMTAVAARSDPLAHHQLCSLAAYDDRRLQDVQRYLSERAGRLGDSGWQDRAQRLIDDTLTALRQRQAVGC